jgi:hypothetical protein
MMRDDIGSSRFSDRGKAFRFLLAALALAAVMLPPHAWAETGTGAGAGGDASVSPCPDNTIPIQIIVSTPSGTEIRHSVVGSSHFSTFVTAIGKHITARLDKDKLCINGAGDMESMRDANDREHSLLQFVSWRYSMPYGYTVPMMTLGSPHPSCRITSPWIDLDVYRTPVPQVRGIVYWSERQLLADQAVLAGAKNVPPGRAMPLTLSEKGHFLGEYLRSGTREADSRKSATKPLEERVPPDMLWLFRHAQPNPDATSSVPLGQIIGGTMFRAREKSAKGYTKLVLALIDRCFDASAPGRVNLHYGNILDIADPVLLKQYRIDPPLR